MLCPLMSGQYKQLECVKDQCVWWAKKTESNELGTRQFRETIIEGCAIKVLAEK